MGLQNKERLRFIGNADAYWEGGPEGFLLFIRNLSDRTSFKSPHGFRGALTQGPSWGDDYRLTMQNDGTVYLFNWLGILKNVIDRNGNKLTFTRPQRRERLWLLIEHGDTEI
jgi:hypothetical protein